MAKTLIALAILTGCSCNDKELGFSLGEMIPPYPDTILVENTLNYEKHRVDKVEPCCGVVHRYFVTTDHSKNVLSVWRQW